MREAGEIFFWLLFAAALLLWKPERTNPCLWCPLENTTAGNCREGCEAYREYEESRRS